MTGRGLITALAVAGTLLAPVASAQERTPSPKELWDAYPANPGGEPTIPPDERATATPTASGGVAGAQATSPRGASGEGDDGAATGGAAGDGATGDGAAPGGATGGAAATSGGSPGDAASDGGPPLVPAPIMVAIAVLALGGGVLLWRRHRSRWGVSRALALRYVDEDVAEPAPPPPPPPVPKPVRRDFPQPARPAPPAPPPPPAPRSSLQRERTS